MTNSEITKQTQELLPPDPRALNPRKHGALSESVPDFERDAYDLHRAGVLDSLAPVGYLEEKLAGRVAMTLWRLSRLEGWEAAELGKLTRKAVAGLVLGNSSPHLRALAELDARKNAPVPYMGAEDLRAAMRRVLPYLSGEHALSIEVVEDVEEAVRERSNASTFLRAYLAGQNDHFPTDESAVSLLGEWALQALKNKKVSAKRIAGAALNTPKPSREAVQWIEDDEWAWEAAELPGVLALVREVFGNKLEEAAHPALWTWEREAAVLPKYLARAAELRQEAAHTLPDERTLEKLQRYEAHLERQLYKAMHELEAMQERRAGRAAPLARIEVHGGLPGEV